MPTIDTLVIGAGQAGLAASRCLTDRGVDHVVLERGRVAERWRTERWDSLRLLTPNWMTRLPGWSYTGPDPHGFMTAAEVAAYFRAYADASAAPVVEDSAVVSVHRNDGSFGVTDHFQPLDGQQCRHRHRAGATNRRCRPWPAASIPASPRSPLPPTATRARCPKEESWSSARRPPACSSPTSSHTPAAMWSSPSAATPACPAAIGAWTSSGGSSGSAASTAPSTRSATRRRLATNRPSKLVGRPDHPNLDLTTLAAAGVRLAGRLAGVDGHYVSLRGDLAVNVAAADTRMRRVLADIDAHVSASGLTAEVLDPEPQPLTPSPTRLPPLDTRRKRDHSRHLGDRIPPHLSLAAPPGTRHPWRDPSIPRRHSHAWCVRHGATLPAPAKLQLHRRRRPRRRVHRRPPRPRRTAQVSPTLNEEPSRAH